MKTTQQAFSVGLKLKAWNRVQASIDNSLSRSRTIPLLPWISSDLDLRIIYIYIHLLFDSVAWVDICKTV